MMAAFRQAWTTQRGLMLALLVLLALTLIAIARLGLHWSHRAAHAESDVAPWMTIRYVARRNHVHPNSVFVSLRRQWGLKRGEPESIAAIARRTGKTVDEVMASVAIAIKNAPEVSI